MLRMKHLAVCSVGVTLVHLVFTRWLFYADSFATQTMPDWPRYVDVLSMDFQSPCIRPLMLQGSDTYIHWVSVFLSPWLLYSPQAIVSLLLLCYLFSSTAPENAKTGRVSTFMALSYLAVAIRAFLAWMFFRALSWSWPSLFSHTVLQECANHGPLVGLVALLVVSSLTYFNRASLIKIKISVLPVLSLSLMLAGWMNVHMFWNMFSGWLAGIIYSIVDQSRSKIKVTSSHEKTMETRSSSRYLWRLFIVVTVSLLAAYLLGMEMGNNYVTDDSSTTLSTSNLEVLRSLAPMHKFVLTLLIISAPRSNDPPFLLETMSSYIPNIPSSPTDPLFSRVSMVVYSHFPVDEHTVLKSATQQYKENPFVTFVTTSDDGPQIQKRHFAAALTYATKLDTQYVMLLEDDFPLCEGCWKKLMTVLVYAQSGIAAGHCGIFVGTGGSGLIIRHEMIPVLAQLLVTF